MKKSMGSRRIRLIHSFPPGQLYTNIIFKSYLNIAYLTKVLKTAQFWHDWQLLILGSTGTVLNSSLHFPSHVFPRGEDALLDRKSSNTTPSLHSTELSWAKESVKHLPEKAKLLLSHLASFFYSNYLK